MIVLKFIWRTFGAVVTKWCVTRKWLIKSEPDLNLGLGGTSRAYIWYIWYLRACSVQGNFGALVSKWPVICKHIELDKFWGGAC